MKRPFFFVLVVITLIAQHACAQKIVFKDQNLKSALLDKGYDFNKDGEIEISEIDTVTKLDISKREIKSLNDLSYFKSLISINANTNQIKDLDVFFDNNTIEQIYIGKNLLSGKLILKNMKSLTGLYAFKNNLTEIDLSGTDSIKLLYLQDNLFEKIGFKNLPNLTSLELSGNKKLKLVDISFNRALEYLYLLDVALSKLDITNNTLLNTLYVEKSVKLIKNDTQSNFKPAPIIRTIN
jgi:glutaredoxin-related protein